MASNFFPSANEILDELLREGINLDDLTEDDLRDISIDVSELRHEIVSHLLSTMNNLESADLTDMSIYEESDTLFADQEDLQDNTPNDIETGNTDLESDIPNNIEIEDADLKDIISDNFEIDETFFPHDIVSGADTEIDEESEDSEKGDFDHTPEFNIDNDTDAESEGLREWWDFYHTPVDNNTTPKDLWAEDLDDNPPLCNIPSTEQEAGLLFLKFNTGIESGMLKMAKKFYSWLSLQSQDRQPNLARRNLSGLC